MGVTVAVWMIGADVTFIAMDDGWDVLKEIADRAEADIAANVVPPTAEGVPMLLAPER